MKYITILAVAALAALAIGPACADVNFGAYARSVAMGGAGLAVVDNPTATGAINPAAYALKSPGFRLLFPGVDFRMEGTSLSDLMDVARDVQDAKGESAIALARELGKRNTKVEVGAYAGFIAGPVAITADGQAAAELVPSDGFKSWANSESSVDWVAELGDLGLAGIQDKYHADVTGRALVSLPSVGVGFKIPNGRGLCAGLRVKFLRSTVRYQRVQPSDVDLTGQPEFEAVPQPGEPEEVEDSGLGADVGFIYQTPGSKVQLTTALVLSNLIRPNLEGVGLERMISAGAALRLSNKLLLAGDLVNINGAYDRNTQLRLGAELSPVRWFALRAGYSGGDFTFGLGLGGLNIAVSKDTPLIVGRVWSL